MDFFFYVFFLIESWSRQKNGRLSWTDSMTGERGRQTSVLPLQKKGVKKDGKKNQLRTFSQSLNKHFFSLWNLLVPCDYRMWMWFYRVKWTKNWLNEHNYFPCYKVSCCVNSILKSNRRSQSERKDSLLVLCQILLLGGGAALQYSMLRDKTPRTPCFPAGATDSNSEWLVRG